MTWGGRGRPTRTTFLGHTGPVESQPWVPLNGVPDEHAALVEEVAEWMAPSLWEWTRGAFTRRVRTGTTSQPRFASYFDAELLRRAERECRFASGFRGISIDDGLEAVQVVVALGRVEHLRLIDFLVRIARGDQARLDDILLESGSAWKVGTRDGHQGLERRVPLGVHQAAEGTIASSGQAGQRLSEAWHAAFGISPNPSHAYALAVRAVEDASVPLVVPRQAGATLGHVIGQLRNDGDWSLPLTREDTAAPTAETVLRMCQALWKGHHDRHGGDPAAPQAVDQSEAETATLLAVPLVHWFMSGAIARR